MKKSLFVFFLLLSAASVAGAQILRDDFNRAATSDVAGSMKWRRALNLNDTSATFQINSDSSISPRNLLGPFNRGAIFWDSLVSGRVQTGIVIDHKNGGDGIPSVHLLVMNDSNWLTAAGYAVRFQSNPGQDRMDLQRFAGNGTDTPTVTLLATMNREFADGDSLFLKIYPDGRKTAVYYGISGARDSISVVDTVVNPAAWIPWVEGRVFADPLRLDNYMLAPIPYLVTASAGAGGSITPSGSTLVNPGDSAVFSIVPDPGYFISDVIVDSMSIGPMTEYVFEGVSANHTIAAVFDTADYTIVATAGAGGSISPSDTIGVSGGSDISFTMLPDTGFHVDSVVVDGVNQGAVTVYDFLDVVANHTIAAFFSINTYTITATASAGGTIAPSGSVTVQHGADQSFLVTADADHHVDSVVVDGVNQGALGGFDFLNVTASHSISAFFSIDKDTITATASSGGSITPSGTVIVDHGDDRTFTVTADPGFHIDSVVVDGVSQGAVAAFQFDSVIANHTIAAFFSINTYTITASASAGGSIAPSGSVSVNHGASQGFTITPNTGFHIDSVVVDGVSQGAVASHTFTNVTANHTIAAYFSINTYTITATASAGGSISPSGSIGVPHGNNQSFTISASTGFHIDSVVVDGVSQGPITNHTFTNVTANHTIAAHFSINTYTITATAGAGGSIAPSGPVAVPHGNSQAFTITPNTGYHIDSVLVDGVNQGAVTGHTFTGVTANHTIAAFFSINTYTITATADAGGSISPSGSVSVNHGANQAFTITPNTGFHIDSVVADGVNQGAVTNHTFTNVTANHTIAAYFSINTYTITATADAGGSISPSGSVSVNHGASQVFTVTPNTGFHIDSVVVDGANQGAVTNHTFTSVTANHTIAAYFSINTYTITATADAGGSISPSGSVSVNHGANQAFTITPNTGFHIDSVVADGVNQGAVTGHTFTGVTANHTIAAYFSINTYTITATAGAGGSISPSGSVSMTHGNNQAFTITPTAGFHIDSVVVDGVNQGAVTNHTFTNVTANHTIAAYFSINTYTITATADAGGSISPSGSVSVNHGANQVFTVTPNTGFHIDSVVVDGTNAGAIVSHQFDTVTANHTIAAYFSIDTYSVTATAGPGGSISPSGSVSVDHGSSQAFTITPNTGFHIDSVVADGASLGAVANHTFTNVTANHTIAAYFSINTYTITATAGAGGSVSPAGSVGVNHGGNQSFTVLPDTGHHVDSVVVDGVNQGAVGGYDFLGVTGNHTIAAYFSIDSFTVAATAGPNGSITPAGMTRVAYGGAVSYTIAPAPGYSIANVMVDSVAMGPIAAYDFTGVSGNHSISATFVINAYTILATASAGGSISPAGTVGIDHGADTSFTITPNTGYHIDSVVVDGVDQGAVTSHSFVNVTGNRTIAAYFSINVYTITAAAGPGGGITPSGAVGVAHGSDQSFTVTPNAGYHIDSVVADGVNLGAVTGHSFTGVSAGHTITAYFSINIYTISAAAGANGSITPSGATAVAHGDSVSYSIVPDVGYYIVDVFADTVSLGPVTGYTFTNVTSDHEITATFAIRVFTISATASTGGSITPAGPVSVNYGADTGFTVAPSTGYHLDSVVADGVNLGAVGTYTFTGVTANHTIAAYFSINIYSVTASAGPNGSISPAGASPVAHGDTLTYTITPAVGYHVDSVLVDGIDVGAVTVYAFMGVTGNHTIAAYFGITDFTINASSSAGGTISPGGAVGVTYGASRMFTMTPSTGYHLDSVVVDGVNMGTPATYTFVSVTSAGHTIAAYYSINFYTITASAGSGGSITPLGATTLPHGSSQSYTITPGVGYRIQDVLVDGVSVGQPASYSFTGLSASHTIQAVFALRTFSMAAVSGANGAVSPAGTTTVNYGDSLRYTITPNPGFYILDVTVDGVGMGPVSSYTFHNVTSNHTIAATFTSNATPTAFSLVAPADGARLNPSAKSSLRFRWRRSFDANPGDVLNYVLTLTGPGVNFSSFNLADTTVVLDLTGLPIANLANYRWTVRVTDGTVTVASPDTFDLVFDPTTSVEDGPGGIPAVYALRQNYPNPFNPSTVIPFDLPERSDVRIALYNLLGAEVLEVAAGETLPAGRYVREVSFDGLPSGVYFCRMGAKGESGAVFEQVIRMVLMR